MVPTQASPLHVEERDHLDRVEGAALSTDGNQWAPSAIMETTEGDKLMHSRDLYELERLLDEWVTAYGSHPSAKMYTSHAKQLRLLVQQLGNRAAWDEELSK